jgi:TPR repeat protein
MGSCPSRVLAIGALLCLSGSGVAAAAADDQSVTAAEKRGDYRAAYQQLLGPANAGDAEAQAHRCWTMYNHYYSPGTMYDAIAWCQRVADGGNTRGMSLLAMFYYQGIGTRKDMAKFVYWKQRAADLGLRGAAGDLAVAYEAGLGVPRDPALAAKYRRMAAGGAGDRTEVAGPGIAAKVLHDNGRCNDAIHDDGAAAERGAAEAQVWVGQCLLERRGDAASQACGISLLRRSADAGNGNGLYFLRLAYRKGIGVHQDLGRALALFKRADNGGTGLAPQEIYDIKSGTENARWCRQHPGSCNGAPSSASSEETSCSQHDGNMIGGACVRYYGRHINPSTGYPK